MNTSIQNTTSTPSASITAPFNDLDFSSRDTYLAWVIRWKAAYAAHTALTVQSKHERKAAQRQNENWKADALATKVGKAKIEAQRLIALRHDSKQEAQRQFLAQRQAATAS